MADVKFITEKDAMVLKRMVEWWRQERATKIGDVSGSDTDNKWIDTYVARIPDEKTLAAYDAEKKTPGSLECEIYQPDGTREPIKMGFTEDVLNFSGSSFSPGFVSITREKFGFFIVGSGGGGCSFPESDEYDDSEDFLTGSDTSEDGACKRFSEPVCTTLRNLDDGEYDAEKTKLVGVNEEDNACELYSVGLAICETIGTYTEEEHDQDVRLVGHDSVTDTCHLYDVFSQIQELKDAVCKLAAIVDQLVTEAAIGGNDICP